jgi:hypothetical protein
MYFDILSYIVIVTDILIISFLLWRVFDKKATLWGYARGIYVWIATLTLYHGIVYIGTLFSQTPDKLINNFLHPIVILFIINPLLIAIIHWRGGRLL